MISFIEDALGIFISTIKNQYCQFSGRTSRRNYWMYYLVSMTISVPLSIIEAIFELPIVLSGIFMIVTFLPGMGLVWRRLHDVNKNAWNILWVMIPILGGIYYIYLMCRKGDPGPNDFGPVA